MNFNIPEFTVSEFSSAIKNVIEGAFQYVRIKGEITGFKRASSGHLYFSLKDEDAVLSAVLFKNLAIITDFEIADGIAVVASGRITNFANRSNYQIIVEKLEMSGVGAALEMIEKRRKKLLAEGLFDDSRKKKIPFFPKTIGVITSKTGAVIQDIIHRIQDRCPAHILLYPSQVQGSEAVKNIIKGITYFNNLQHSIIKINNNSQNSTEYVRPDVIIIARGGGSFEDLLVFNDEDLVRAVFASKIPIISAVGHETDTTLIDYVADLRAPTPTAAAEFATPVLDDLKNNLNYTFSQLKFVSKNFLEDKFLQINYLQKYIVSPRAAILQIEEKILRLSEKLKFIARDFYQKSEQRLIKNALSSSVILHKINIDTQSIQYAFERLKSSIRGTIKNSETALINLTKLLENNHYERVFEKGFSLGFALVKDKNSKIVSSIYSIKKKDEITLEFKDGTAKTYIVDINKKNIIKHKTIKNNATQQELLW
jgi:exodeoxyribonuclease VII large subunit